MNGNQTLNKPYLESFCHIMIFFLYMFQPNFMPLKTIYLMDMLMILINVFFILKRGRRFFYINKKIVGIILGFSPFFLYYCLMITGKVISNKYILDLLYINNIRVLFLVTIRLFLAVGYLVFLTSQRGYSYDNIIDLFIYAALIQMVFVIIAFLSPDARELFNGLMVKYTDSVSIIRAVKTDTHRSYGLAGNLFDAFGYLTSLLILFTFQKGLIIRSTRWIILSLIMLLMPLLNARTGVFLALAGMVVILLVFHNTSVRYLVWLCGLSILAVALVWILFTTLPEITKDWIIRGFVDTGRLIFKQEKVGVWETLLDTNLIMPRNVLFGDGGDPIDVGKFGIESGYMQCIWRYGIVGTILLILGFLNLFLTSIVSSKCWKEKSIVTAFAVIFFIYLIKLFSIYNTGANFVILGIPLLIILKVSNKEATEMCGNK